MKRSARWVGVVLAAVAVGLPAGSTATALAGAAASHMQEVVWGVWAFKALLLLHAGLMTYWSTRRGAGAGNRVAETSTSWNPSPISRAEGWVLAGILCVGAGLRFLALGQGLWLDEIRTLVGYVRQPLGAILTSYDSQNQHMLYSALARAATVAFGESAASLRIPAVILGIGSLWSVWWFGRGIASRGQALLATALLAFSYHHVWFSQNARGYTGLLLGSVVGTGLFIQLLGPRTRRVAGWTLGAAYVGTMALAVYTHVTAAFVGVSHLLVWGVTAWKARSTSGGGVDWAPGVAVLVSGAATLQLYALVLPQMLRVLSTPTMAGVSTQWKDPVWLIGETLRGLMQGLPGGAFTVGVAAAVGAVGLWSYWRQDRVATAAMVVPVILTAGAYLLLGHNLWPRMFFFAAGFAALIGVRGIFSVGAVFPIPHGPRVAAAVVAAAIAVSAWTVPRAWHPKQDFEGALTFVERVRASDDAVVTVDLTRYPFREYIGVDWLAVESARELEGIERRHARTWVLYTFPTRLAAVHPDVWDRLQTEYEQAADFPGTVGGGTVVIMLRG